MSAKFKKERVDLYRKNFVAQNLIRSEHN